jgi:hypothetical protein
MTTRFHERIFALLGPNAPIQKISTSKLTAWAHANVVQLPQAYIEWAELDGERILTQYSNRDSFYFEEPEIVTTPDGVRGLLFHQENQGNFQKIVVLNGSDDPPVLFGCIGRPPWIEFSRRFSDCVFAQIFDWQFMLDDGEITFFGDIGLRSDRCISILRSRFEETVSTRFVMDERYTREYRFIKSDSLRLTVGVHEEVNPASGDVKAYVVITGKTAVAELEAQLFDVLSDDVVPPSFSSPRTATGELIRTLLYRGLTQVRHMAIEKPELEIVAWLAECHSARPLDERLNAQSFPETGTRFVIRDKESGITLHFLRQNKNWWWIERIETSDSESA